MAPASPPPPRIMAVFLVVSFLAVSARARLTTDFYHHSCPKVFQAIKPVVRSAIQKEARMGASPLRLFCHDCFVNGCDGSLLLDDTPTFTGEKNAAPNQNSVRGFNVIDRVKAAVERECPGVVSCADVLAITARDSVHLLGGPYWDVKLGRRDARTASQAATNNSIPPPTSNLNQLISFFHNVGLSARDMVALSGSHTIGQARCTNFRARVYNETDLDPSFARTRKNSCPRPNGVGDNNLAPLDQQTRTFFDNNYYKNLLQKKGLLHSDQQLYNGGSTDSLVKTFGNSQRTFVKAFINGMIKMGDIRPLTGSNGEVRKNCRRVN